MRRKKDINIDKKSVEYKRLYQRFYYYKRKLNIKFKEYHNNYYLDKIRKAKINKTNNIPSEESIKEGVVSFD